MEPFSLQELKQKTLGFLGLAGLADWERNALLHLLLHGISTPVQVASAAGIPRNKIYGVLDSLEKRAVIYKVSIAGGKNLYQAVRPEEIFELLARSAYKMMELRTEILGRLVELYEGALANEDNIPLESFVSVTDSRTAVNSMLASAFKACREEVFLSGTDFRWLTEAPMLLTQLEAKGKQGVRVKALIVSDPKVPQSNPSPALRARNFLVRKTNSIQSSVIIIDRRDVYLAIRRKTRRATESPEIFVRLSSSEFAQDFVRVLDEAWETAVPEA